MAERRTGNGEYWYVFISCGVAVVASHLSLNTPCEKKRRRAGNWFADSASAQRVADEINCIFKQQKTH